MKFYELLFIALALAMDAFAVSICKGLSSKNITIKEPLLCGIWFGIFQALMPLIGFLLGSLFVNYIEPVDHWVAFILLGFIGGKMIYGSIKGEENVNSSFAFKSMLIMAVATSIDALAVGITFSISETNIWIAILTIGIITFGLSVLGVIIGHKVGPKFGNKAELLGGIILILMGIKILIEHLFFN